MRASNFKMVFSHTHYVEGKRTTDATTFATFDKISSDTYINLVNIDGDNVADAFYKASHIDAHGFAALWVNMYGDVLDTVSTLAIVNEYNANPFGITDVFTAYNGTSDNDKIMEVDRKASVSTFDPDFTVRVVGEVHRTSGLNDKLVARVYDVCGQQYILKVDRGRLVLRRYTFSSFFKALDKRIASACNDIASLNVAIDKRYHHVALDLVRVADGESRIRNMMTADNVDISELVALLKK